MADTSALLQDPAPSSADPPAAGVAPQPVQVPTAQPNMLAALGAGAGRGFAVPPLIGAQPPPTMRASAPPIPGTGMGGAGLQMQQYRTDQAEINRLNADTQRSLQREGDFYQQDKDLRAREAERVKRREAEENANLQAQRDVRGQKLPPLTQQSIPGYKSPLLPAEEAQKQIGLMTVVAALFGAITRTPMIGTMAALSGTVKGYNEGNDQLVQRSMQEYDRNVRAIQANNEVMKSEWDAAKEEKKNDLEGLQIEAKIIATKFDAQAALDALQHQDITKGIEMMDKTVSAHDKLVEQYRASQDRIVNNMANNQRYASMMAMAQAAANPGTVDMLAERVMAGDTRVYTEIGSSRYSMGLRMAVLNRVTEMGRERGRSAVDQMVARADYTGLSRALADREKNIAAVGQFSKQLDAQANLVLKYAKEGIGGDVDIVNHWVQGGRSGLGSPELRQFDTAIRGLAREHQRIVTAATSNAQLHTSAQQTADELLNRDFNYDEIEATIQTMRAEGQNAISSGRSEVDDLKNAIRGLGQAPTSGGQDLHFDATGNPIGGPSGGPSSGGQVLHFDNQGHQLQ